MRTIQDLTEHLRAEYLEMPGLRLTAEQLQRLCGIEQTVCQLILQELVNAKFLFVTPSGHYARVTEGRVPRPRVAKAELRSDTPSDRAS